MLQSYKAFSLIEILIWILIISIIMVAAFQTLSSVWIAKVKLIERVEIEKQAYFSSERFFELIKKWWTLDYEEYWNRYSYDNSFVDGYFANISWFGNYADAVDIWSISYDDSLYYCVSPNSWSMWTWGCLLSHNTEFLTIKRPQLFWQYEQQFIDRNSDGDTDGWDEDGDGSIIWDDDDLFLGIWPPAFSGSIDVNKVWELYLISNDGTQRTYFRWRVEELTWSFVPSWAVCDLTSNPEHPVWEACQGTIEMLQLIWADHWFDHDSWIIDADGSQWDGKIDTWFIHPDYASWNSTIVAGSNTNNYWQAIFPSTIHIKDFEIYAYPQKDLNLSWKDNISEILISPYIQIKYTIQPSLSIKAKIKWVPPSVDIATTINLLNLDIK